MTIPDKLPIMRMEDYHTHYLGKVADGRLFWGYQTFAFNKPYAEIQQGDDLKKHRKEYVLVHTFDKNGNYLTTKYWVAALTTDLNEQQLENKLEELVTELGDIVLQDIEIKIFQTQIDNITFGLIVDEETEMINLQPSSTISFQEPWDGEYYT
jgi:formate hydrogenlyase regulatory protein HycA